ncbi:MAG: metallophosphatase family protein, partial [Planctomycetota bacterium]
MWSGGRMHPRYCAGDGRRLLPAPRSLAIILALVRGRHARPERLVPYPLTALISDLHGNWPALQTALADARARGATRYVCLGDVVGYGARPRDCVLLVMELVAGRDATPGAPALVPGICLRGNHEDGLLGVAEDFNPKARAAIDWTRDELTRRGADNDAVWEFLDACSPWAEDELAMYAHGSPR